MKYFLDCGSNLGQGYEHFRDNYYGDSYTYILFEPNPNCYKKLLEKYSSRSNVHIFNLAVYSSNCTKTFRFENEFSVGGSLIENHNSAVREPREETEVTCVDLTEVINFITDKGSEVIIKMDIESAEYDVLEKMIETGTIFKVKYMYIEFHIKFMTDEDRTIFAPREEKIRKFLSDNKIDYVDW